MAVERGARPVYLATFLPFQPDLNWRNPEVKAAMFDAVRFWLDRGSTASGLDIFGQIMKDPSCATIRSPPHGHGFPARLAAPNTENTPDNIVLAQELHAVCAEYSDPDRILLGECSVRPMCCASTTPVAGVWIWSSVRLPPVRVRRTVVRGHHPTVRGLIPGADAATHVLENHDRSRSLDRVGGDRRKAAAVLAVILLTVRGVPTVYMGQEIGMGNTLSPAGPGPRSGGVDVLPLDPEVANRRLGERLNRDEVRTPMQWDGSANGFTPAGIRPWLPVNPTIRR